MKKLSLILVFVLVVAASLCIFSACSVKYDLVYANWNLGTEAGNNIERQMIKAFEEKHNVKIKIEESVSLEAWDDSLKGLYGKKAMPDVYMINSTNFVLTNGYAADISDLVADDQDWKNIPGAIEQAVHYKSGIYAIPFAMHMMGYFVNVNLLEECHLDKKLDGEFTYDVLLEIVSAMANRKADGYLGLNEEKSIFEWYPASVNENYGWFTWDGASYHLDSDEFKDAIEKTKTMHDNNYTWDSLAEGEYEEYYEGVEGSTALWDQGKLAIRWGATYEIPDMTTKNEGAFEIVFLGVPGGRTPVVGDYLAISNTSENKELAYEFAKWMSFGPDGIRERIKRENSVTNTLPLTTDQTIIDEYFDQFNEVTGIADLFATLDKGIVEGVKVVPGYTRSRWKASTGIPLTIGDNSYTNAEIGVLLDACWANGYIYADYATQANELANKQYQDAVKKYADLYK